MMEDRLPLVSNSSVSEVAESDDRPNHDGGILYFTYIRDKLMHKKEEHVSPNKTKGTFTTKVSLPPPFADNAAELLEVISRPSPLFTLQGRRQLEERKVEHAPASLPKLTALDSLVSKLTAQEKRAQQAGDGGGRPHSQGGVVVVEPSLVRQRSSGLARPQRKGRPPRSSSRRGQGDREKRAPIAARPLTRPQTISEATTMANGRCCPTPRGTETPRSFDVLKFLDKGVFPLKDINAYGQLALPEEWEEVVSISLAGSRAKEERDVVEGLRVKGRHPGVSLKSIRSYHVLLDLQDPDAPLESCPTGYDLLHSGSSIGRENLNRFRHNFRHIQYTKQVELIDYLQWRSARNETARNNSNLTKTHATLKGNAPFDMTNSNKEA